MTRKYGLSGANINTNGLWKNMEEKTFQLRTKDVWIYNSYIEVIMEVAQRNSIGENA